MEEDGGRTEGGTFPDYNPYTIRRCRDCGMNSGKGKLAFVAENELCEACRLVRKCAGDSKKTGVPRRRFTTGTMRWRIF